MHWAVGIDASFHSYLSVLTRKSCAGNNSNIHYFGVGVEVPRSTEDMKAGRGCNICFKRVTRRAIISNVDATGAVMACGLCFRGNS